MDSETLGDIQKEYETIEAGQVFIPGLPIIVRLDGRSFSTFTRSLAKPYDKRLSDLMIATTTYLVKETSARVGYTQSDEITLVIHNADSRAEPFFGGRKQKIISTIAALANAYFNKYLAAYLPEKKHLIPTLDCRAWCVPTLEYAAANLLWRENDATRNSISMAANTVYSHKELHGKHTGEKQEMLFQKGINWNDYPVFFKRGTYVFRVKKEVKFSTEEIAKLPPKHMARTNPDFLVERYVVEASLFPQLGKVTNKVDALFNGLAPILKTEE